MKGNIPSTKAKARAGADMARGRRITAVAGDGRRSALHRLVGALQEKHGWNRERATKELRRKIAKREYN